MDKSLAELKQLAEYTTPGPWRFKDFHDYEALVAKNDTVMRSKTTSYEGGSYLDVYSTADEKIIALAPELLAEVIRLREQLGEYISLIEGEVSDLNSPHGQSDKADALDMIATDLTRILEDENMCGYFDIERVNPYSLKWELMERLSPHNCTLEQAEQQAARVFSRVCKDMPDEQHRLVKVQEKGWQRHRDVIKEEA